MTWSTLGREDMQLLEPTASRKGSKKEEERKRRKPQYSNMSVRLDKESFGSTEPQTDPLCTEHIPGKTDVGRSLSTCAQRQRGAGQGMEHGLRGQF